MLGPYSLQYIYILVIISVLRSVNVSSQMKTLSVCVGDICLLANCPMQRSYESHLDRHDVFWNATYP